MGPFTVPEVFLRCRVLYFTNDESGKKKYGKTSSGITDNTPNQLAIIVVSKDNNRGPPGCW